MLALLPAAVACADEEVPSLYGVKTGSQTECVGMDGGVANFFRQAVPVGGLGDFRALPAENVVFACDFFAVPGVVEFLAVVVVACVEFVLAAEQGVFAVKVAAEIPLVAVAVAVADKAVANGAVCADIATLRHVTISGLRGTVFVFEGAVQFPIVIELVVKLGKGILFLIGAAVPACAEVGAARQAQVVTFFVSRQAE